MRESAPIRILVAEDHDGVRQALVRMLGLQEDMEVVAEATDGVEAIRLAIAMAPDILLLDVRMPGMDGIKVIEELRRVKCPVKIIVLSAHEDETYISDAVRSGADSYLLKGMPMRSVVEAVRNVAGGTTVFPPGVVEPLARKYREQDETVKAFKALLEAGARKGAILEAACSNLRNILRAESACVYALGGSGVEGRPELLASCREEECMGECGKGATLSTAELRSLLALTEEDKVAVYNSFRAPSAEDATSDCLHVVAIPLRPGGKSSHVVICVSSLPFNPQPSVLSLMELLASQISFMLKACEDADRVTSQSGRALALEEGLAASLPAVARAGGSEQALEKAALLLEAKALFVAWRKIGEPGDTAFLARGIGEREARSLLREMTPGAEVNDRIALETQEAKVIERFPLPIGLNPHGRAGILLLPFCGEGEGLIGPLRADGVDGPGEGRAQIGTGSSTPRGSRIPPSSTAGAGHHEDAYAVACRENECASQPPKRGCEAQQAPVKGLLCALGDYTEGFLGEKREILQNVAAAMMIMLKDTGF